MIRKTLRESIKSLTPGDFGTLKDILIDMVEMIPETEAAPEPAEHEDDNG